MSCINASHLPLTRDRMAERPVLAGAARGVVTSAAVTGAPS